MHRAEIERRLTERTDADGYLYPDYDGYCVANVPGSILSRLGASTEDRLPPQAFRAAPEEFDIALVWLLDGFGYRLWNRYESDFQLLSTAADLGSVTPLTSVYPSETAAAITTIHTGRVPSEHHLLGWFQYLDSLDLTVASLPFVTPEGTPVTDRRATADPRMLFEGTAVYERAANEGIDSTVIQPAEVSGSEYSTLVTAGATSVGYDGLRTLPATVRNALEQVDPPAYVFVYLPQIDAAGHEVGTQAPEFHEAVADVIETSTVAMAELDRETAERTMAVVTADHGLLDTTPSTKFDVSAIDGFWEALRRDGDGNPIPPSGSARNLHLHLDDGRESDVRDMLSAVDARVFTRAAAKDRQLFGPRGYGAAFDRRCGDLVVSPLEGALWHRERERSFVSHHGGLHPDEMMVPFAAAPGTDLQA